MGSAIRFRLRGGARHTLRELDRLLDSAYGAPAARLENKEDPLDEAVYIVLSLQTDLNRFKAVWRDLRTAFPAWEEVAQAPCRRLVDVLRIGGLQEQKARTIRGLLSAVKLETGAYSLDILKDMSDAEAERFLTRLPGFSWKAARCVLLYSLDREVFPIDGNTFRILKRAGVLGPKSIYRRRGLHDGLQRAIEPSRRKPFHVNLVIHGQETCLPRRPRCFGCAVRSACAMCGVPESIRARPQDGPRSESGKGTVSRTRARG